MKKRICSLLLSVLIIFICTGCGGSENKENGAVTKSEKTVAEAEKAVNETGKDTPVTEHAKEEKKGLETIRMICGEGYKEDWADDTYDTVIKVSYPVVMPYYEDENKFPELKKALEDNNKSTRDYQLRFFEDNAEYAKAEYDGDNEYYHPFESSVSATVRRADTLVTSILYSGFTYSGGMNGESFYHGENYNSRTGKILELSDVVDDMDLLPDAIYHQLDMFYTDEITDSGVDVAELIKDGSLYSWTLDYNGITFYFLPYAINSASNSEMIVTLLNEEYPDVLKKEYQEIPSAYGVELARYVPFYADVTGDGKVDKISASGHANDTEGNSGCIDIMVNNDSYMEDEWFYDYNAVFVHMADGRSYIYYEILRENDYREIVCFDVKNGVKKVGSISGGLRMIYHEGDEYVTTQDALTNPESFNIQIITQHLSTVTGYKKYRTGDDGIPVSDDEMFTFDEERMVTFKLLKDIEVDVYDGEKNKATGRKTLKAGDEVLYYATDNEKYALLKCSDGILCRVEGGYDVETQYYVVNGHKLEEVFDGILFAG